jgi:hypothetical protein
MVLEGAEEGSVAPLELSDGVMEQVEVMVKELKKISRGLWALVEGVGRLTEVVEGMGKKEYYDFKLFIVSSLYLHSVLSKIQ